MILLELVVFGVNVRVDLFSLLVAIAVPLVLYLCFKRPKGLPPFPSTPIPVLGNLLSLEKDPRAQFCKWRKKHGEIFSVYFGPKLTIVLNGFDVIKEAVVKNADVFSDRPDIGVFTLILGGKGIISTSGPQWKAQRKYSLTALKEFGFGRKSMEAEILIEVQNVLDFFSSKRGEKHDFSYIYNISTSNVICLMMFGHRFQFDDPNFVACCKALNDAVANFSNLNLINFFPFLAKLPKIFRSTDTVIEKFAYFEEHLIMAEIKQHRESYDETTPDFIAAFIKDMKERESAGLDVSGLKDNFTETIRDLFVAGTETTATTLKWMILFLIHYPEVQEKCFQEIKSNIGIERFPTLQDKPNLPYLEAMIAETQRRSNIVPFGVLHATSEDTMLRGYNIPKGTICMLNMDSVLMDPQEWPQPEEFRPERFLDKSGSFFKPESFIPFSTGRRVCMGESLAKMELFLFSAALIQNFRFLQPEDEGIPSLEPCVTAALVPQPYTVRAVQRNDEFPNIVLES